MNPNIPAGQIKTRRPILLFIKNVSTPLVLYVDEPDEAYKEIRNLITKASPQSPKMVEKIGKGPVKKVSVLDTQIAGVAIQEVPAI